MKSGAPKPDISTPDALKRALLAAKTVAYSDSASGVYVSTEMFPKLGIAEEMKDKARKIPATPVGEIVAHGTAEIGFQQMSELKPVAGIDIVGPLPDELQKITVFSAGIATVSKQPEAGKALIKFLASPAARGEIVKSGMDPIVTPRRMHAVQHRQQHDHRQRQHDGRALPEQQRIALDQRRRRGLDVIRIRRAQVEQKFRQAVISLQGIGMHGALQRAVDPDRNFAARMHGRPVSQPAELRARSAPAPPARHRAAFPSASGR